MVHRYQFQRGKFCHFAFKFSLLTRNYPIEGDVDFANAQQCNLLSIVYILEVGNW